MSKRNSLFAKFDLDYADHPKIAPLSDAAFRAHVEMILYACRFQTDGRIAKRVANRWETESVTELLTNDPERPSLVELPDGDFMLHEFESMQETRAEIERRRAVNRANGRRGGRPAKRTKTDSVTESLTESGTENLTEMKADIDKDKEDISSGSSREETRPDMQAILDHLDRELEANGFKKPNRTQANIRASRLLLDRDGHTVDEVMRIISFAQSSEFWMTNIKSMSKLREKFDTLQGQAARPQGRPDPRAAAANSLWEREGPF